MITGEQFFKFAGDDESLWSALEGQVMRHKHHGDGIVRSVEHRDRPPPLISVQFAEKSGLNKYNSTSFKSGLFTAVKISGEINTRFLEWVKKCKEEDDKKTLGGKEKDDWRAGVENSRRKKFAEFGVDYFYYITLIENIPSILKHGIFSYNDVKNRQDIDFKSFANEQVRAIRGRQPNVRLSDGSSHNLLNLVPLLFVTDTPTLWDAANRHSDSEFAIIQIKNEVVCVYGSAFAFTDGNAAVSNNIRADPTRFFYELAHLTEVPFDVLRAEMWGRSNERKRQRSAEFLIYPKVDVKYFEAILFDRDISYNLCVDFINEEDPDMEMPPVEISSEPFTDNFKYS